MVLEEKTYIVDISKGNQKNCRLNKTEVFKDVVWTNKENPKTEEGSPNYTFRIGERGTIIKITYNPAEKTKIKITAEPNDRKRFYQFLEKIIGAKLIEEDGS